jgi:protein phosphatase
MPDAYDINDMSVAIIAVAVFVCGMALWLILKYRQAVRRGQSDLRQAVAAQSPAEPPAQELLLNVGGRAVSVTHAQHIGSRDSQQDAYSMAYDEKRLICAVCDGMGGMAMGAEAARLAIDTMMPIAGGAGDTRELIRQALIRASDAVYALCGGRGGTTAVLAVINAQGLSYGAAGDSRIYLCRDGQLAQLGQDHIFYYDLIRSTATPREAAEHPEREHLTSFIGREALTRINQCRLPLPLLAGAAVLIVTDGIYRSIDEPGMLRLLSAGAGAREIAAQALLAQKPAQDNLTVVVARVRS